MNPTDFENLTHETLISEEEVKLFLKNLLACAIQKKKRIGGVEPQLYEEIMIRRIGEEPLFRLIFVLMRDMLSAEITIAEVLSRDPALYCKAIQQDDFTIYYNQYHF